MSEESNISQEAHGNYIAQATSGGHATIQVYTSPPSQQTQNRKRFLVRLRTRYTDLLSQSLQGTVRITLKLAGYPQAVTPPVQLLYKSEQYPSHSLPIDASLAQIYEEVGHELLVLGEPGVGKSTLLLELASELVKQAEQDQSLLLPVIIPLSSWANKRQSLEWWIGEQVALIYDIALPLATQWVQEERLLLLFDGLDEMEELARPACITAINAYHHEHLHPLVVCSRKTEYEAATTHTRLALHGAVVVLPLTREQVDSYLIKCGEPVATLRILLQENPVLQEVATTPLLLSILILTYQGQDVSGLPTRGSLSEQRQHIFMRYVERMLIRKETLTYSPRDLILWVRWLARHMRDRNQTIFYLEHLQPDCLISAQQHSYSWLALRLPAILIGILVGFPIANLLDSGVIGGGLWFGLQFATLGGLLGWLYSRPQLVHLKPPERYRSSKHLRRFVGVIALIMIVGLSSMLSWYWNTTPNQWFYNSYGLIFGTMIGISSFLLSLLLPVHSFAPILARASPSWVWRIRSRQTIHKRRNWLAPVILSIGGYGLPSLLESYDDLRGILGYMLLAGLFIGIISTLVSFILGAQGERVLLIEHLYWTRHSLIRSLFTPKHIKRTLLIAGSFGFVFGLSWGMMNGSGPIISSPSFWSAGPQTLLSSGLLYWILLGLFQGIESLQVEDHARYLPNQGIQRSLYNSIRMALISGGIIGTFSIFAFIIRGIIPPFGFGSTTSNPLLWLWQDLGGALGGLLASYDWPWMVSSALCGGLLMGIIMGGLAVLRHFVIRLLLVRSHALPWDAPQFLEEAKTRILLQRVGGGYSFPHRLLLDYFADLP